MAEPVHHDELAIQMAKFRRYATALGVVLVAAVVFVALTVIVTNGTTQALKDDGDQRACVTDLRIAQAAAQGEELDATLQALAALYGIDPDHPAMPNGTLEPDDQAVARNIIDGLAAIERRRAATVDLEPQNLARLCPR